MLPAASNSLQELINKLRQVGIDRKFLYSRLLPSAEDSYFSGEFDSDNEHTLILEICSILKQVFGWTNAELFGSRPLNPPRKAATKTRFKLPAWRAEPTTIIYTAYANYLARIVLDGSSRLLTKFISTDAQAVRKAVIDQYGKLTLNASLNYVWDLGIPVLPLRDNGSFHGACWRYEGRNVIVLEQTCKYEAWWTFDLFHKLYHAGHTPEFNTMEIIEADATSEESRNSEHGIAANRFACDVVFDSRTEIWAEAFDKEAAGSVEALKRTSPTVPKREDVGVDSFANDIACWLSWKHVDRRGTSAHFRTEDDDPWITARNVFF